MPSIILSDNGVSSGSAGLKTTASNDGVLQLQTTTSGGTATTAVSISNTQIVTVTNDTVVNGLTVGRGAGSVSTNTAVGASALAANTTGARNTVVGYQAAYSTTTGFEIDAFGSQALYSNTTGTENLSVGRNSSYANTTGTRNTVVGISSFANNSTGNYNTSVGWQSLLNNTTASNNTAVGYQAGYTTQDGANNVFVGYQSGYTANTSGGHTMLGYQAGYSSNSSSTANTFVGNSAGYYVTSGLKNTILGRYNGNQGGLDIRTSSNNAVISDGDGNWFIWGQYTTGSKVNGNWLYSGAGTHYMKWNSSTNAWSVDTSSRLVKTDIIDSPYGLDAVLALKPRKYVRTDDGNTEIGFVADEVANVLPELTPMMAKSFFTKNQEDTEVIAGGVDYARITAVLVKAIQELKAEFDAYKATHP
jgi:hypothetical protein